MALPALHILERAVELECEMACGETAPGSWLCTKCTLRNLKFDSGCSACGTWRYSRAHLLG